MWKIFLGKYRTYVPNVDCKLLFIASIFII